jgi:hypothetical protein
LEFYRIDVPEQDGPLTYQQVEELVRERGAVEFTRYEQLLDSIVQNLNNSVVLQRAHEPGVFDGDAIIFSALPDAEIPSWSPESWRPYITGHIKEYSIDCRHEDMLTTESVSLYGQQLKSSLKD